MLEETNSNTFNFMLRMDNEYQYMIDFLEQTNSFCIDGRLVRVWVTLMPPHAVNDGNKCSFPTNSPNTPFDDTSFFSTTTKPQVCLDYTAWAQLVGNLALQYPQIVALSVDDFNSPGQLDETLVTEEYVATMTSYMRSVSPRMNFVPVVYFDKMGAEFIMNAAYDDTATYWPDTPLTFDSMLFYFKNDKHPTSDACTPCGFGPPSCYSCIAGTCAEGTVTPNAATEIGEMAALLPAGRKLHVGTYFSGLTDCGAESNVTVQYDYSLLSTVLSQPSVGGATVYTGSPIITWTHFPGLLSCGGPTTNKACAVQSVYGSF
jgi:hypothetical protein